MYICAAAWGFGIAAVGALAVVPCARAQSQAGDPPTRPASATQSAQEVLATAREQEFWESILALTRSTPATQPYESWFAAARAQRRALLARVQLFLTLYPGGVHRDEAIRIELNTLFELGTLGTGGTAPTSSDGGDDLAALRERVQAYLRNPPSQAALEEAAYWDILCRRSVATTEPTRTPAGSNELGEQPASEASSAPVVGAGDLLAAYRDYVARFPRSRYVPRLASLIFDDAVARGDQDALRSIVAALRASFPDHATTAALAGHWQRVQAVGRPFWLTFRTAENREVDTRTYQGDPVLIVVWAGFHAAARRCVQDVARFQRAYPDLRVVGVSLDDTAEQATAAARELAVSWPQLYDGLGWGGEFVRTWGIRRIPLVLAIDRDGRLLGSAGEEGWEALARAAGGTGSGPVPQGLAGSQPASSRPLASRPAATRPSTSFAPRGP